MSIRHAILGLLTEQPMHGYGLKTAFDERMSPLWGLTTGQVYQTLAALERARFVECRRERVGRRPARKVYSLTETGRQDLDDWLRSAPAAWARPFREEMLIRLMLLRPGDAEVVWRALVSQEQEAAALLARVIRMRERNRSRESADLDLEGTLLDGLSRHLDADIANLRRLEVEVRRWCNRRGLALPVRSTPGASEAVAPDATRSRPRPPARPLRKRL